MTSAESKETQAKQTKKRKSDTKPSDHNGGHGKKKKSRQKQLRDENAPKYPRSSYIHFLSARRADFEKEHADMEKIDINSAMAAEWRSLTDEQKKPYIDQAASDRAKFEQLSEEYQKTDAYKEFMKKKKAHQATRTSGKKGRMGDNEPNEDDLLKAGDIPIFSDKFIEYNRERETLLRNLRKEVGRLEEEEKHLKEHVGEMEATSRTMETEMHENTQRCGALKSQLTKWRKTFAEALKSLPLPGTKDPPTPSTVDAYLVKVHQMSLDSPAANQNFLAKVRDAISKVSLE
uniref:HMG box domain-containing protein n=1 Tax=Plectus sambesii TaxID=2011161 RepID=A0A914WWW3_9BILA